MAAILKDLRIFYSRNTDQTVPAALACDSDSVYRCRSWKPSEEIDTNLPGCQHVNYSLSLITISYQSAFKFHSDPSRWIQQKSAVPQPGRVPHWVQKHQAFHQVCICLNRSVKCKVMQRLILRQLDYFLLLM